MHSRACSSLKISCSLERLIVSGAIPYGQIFSKFLELMSSILKDIFYYYSRSYPPTLSSEASVVSEIFEQYGITPLYLTPKVRSILEQSPARSSRLLRMRLNTFLVAPARACYADS